MPRLSPFRALRYAPATDDPARLIAPPYDVIDPTLAAALRARSPYNAVRLVLPEGEGNDRYAAAAAVLADWCDSGTLQLDERPAVYAYRQRYERDGHDIVRHALFAALELEEPGEGVLPHERTHAGPKADRLGLTLATRAQLSPVFLVARDPEASLLAAIEAVTAGPPVLEATTPDGIEHTLWSVDEEGSAALLCALAGRLPLLIADGHHRYETALEASRRLDAQSAGHVLCCIVSASDPGLSVLPTHRTLTDTGSPESEGFRTGLAERFELRELGVLAPARAAARAAEDPAAMVWMRNGDRGEAVRLLPRERKGTEAGGIAAVHFDRHVVRDLLGTDADAAAAAGRLEYHRSPADAVRRAGTNGATFLLPAVELDAVWRATADGVRLPPKSTYFEPKIPSGLLFRPL